MTVYFTSGRTLYSTPIEEWSQEHLKAFGRVIDNIGSVQDLRFCSVIDRQARFVYVKMDKVDFIDFDQAEYAILINAMNAPEEKPQSA